MENLVAQACAVTSTHTVQRWRGAQVTTATDQLAEEVPVALVYNGVSHAVMLATPQDLEDFALGFSLSEGLLHNKSELYGVEVLEHANGIELHLDIASERFEQLKARRRSLAGRTGCGLCGAESLSQVFRFPAEKDVKLGDPAINIASVLHAHQAIQGLQLLQHDTGATHACAWSDANGQIGLVREDVGRHNALDKLIGALAKQDKTGGFVLTTSRASYEMVQKIAMAGFGMLSAISAPTGLAVRMAQRYQITLIGFVRDEKYVVYSQPDNIEHTSINVETKS